LDKFRSDQASRENQKLAIQYLNRLRADKGLPAFGEETPSTPGSRGSVVDDGGRRPSLGRGQGFDDDWVRRYMEGWAYGTLGIPTFNDMAYTPTGSPEDGGFRVLPYLYGGDVGGGPARSDGGGATPGSDTSNTAGTDDFWKNTTGVRPEDQPQSKLPPLPEPPDPRTGADTSFKPRDVNPQGQSDDPNSIPGTQPDTTGGVALASPAYFGGRRASRGFRTSYYDVPRAA
jgi:hypothetical protein